MAGTWLSIAGLSGPTDITDSVEAPPDLPAGVPLTGLFRNDGWWLGVSSAAIFDATTASGQGTAKSQPQPLDVGIQAGFSTPKMFGWAATGKTIPTVAVISTDLGTGGIAKDWVVAYWLLKNCKITSMQTYADRPPGAHSLSIGYQIATFAEYATPQGGQLGNASVVTYDWAKAQLV